MVSVVEMVISVVTMVKWWVVATILVVKLVHTLHLSSKRVHVIPSHHVVIVGIIMKHLLLMIHVVRWEISVHVYMWRVVCLSEIFLYKRIAGGNIRGKMFLVVLTVVTVFVIIVTS